MHTHRKPKAYAFGFSVVRVIKISKTLPNENCLLQSFLSSLKGKVANRRLTERLSSVTKVTPSTKLAV